MSRQTVQRAFRVLVARAGTLGYLRSPVRLLWGRPAAFPAHRDHAYTTGRSVTVSPKLNSASVERVAGVLAHELGHVAALQAGYAGHSEEDADAIGAAILGGLLGYDGQDVQAAGVRRVRPDYLPK